MKRAYVKPSMIGEQFTPNEYCNSECGTSGKTYNFKCNAGVKGHSYNVYFDNGTETTSDDLAWRTSDEDWYGRVVPNGGKWGVSYGPCGTEHAAASSDEFVTGYMYEQSYYGGNDSGTKIPVIIWTVGRTNTHCTEKLDISSWEVLKS